MSVKLQPPNKTSRNERRKLQATTFNAIGFGSAGLGVLTPLFAGDFTWPAIFRMAVGALIAYIFHGLAVRVLRGMEE